MEQALQILTLNIWGIPYISQDRETRILAISDELSSGKWDIVSLQEVWTQSDFNLIKARTEQVLPHSHYFHSGVMGAGICVFSKYPILVALFHAWSVNGYFHRIQHADWFGGKGVGLCKILVNDKIVNVYNAHLHAEYDNQNDDYKTHRVIQAFDTAQFIESTRCDSALQILAGDLNTQPLDISYNVLLKSSNMKDACPSSEMGTNECLKNSYTPKATGERNPNGIRIDHIFIREGNHFEAKVEDYYHPFPDRVPGQKFSYSDHEGVAVRVKLTPRPSSPNNGYCKKSERAGDSIETIEILQESIKLCNTSLEKLKTDRMLYYLLGLVTAVFLLCLADYSVPFGFKTLYLISKFTLFGVVLFCVFMGSIWNYIERNGVLSGMLAMEIKLNSLRNYVSASCT